MSFHSTAFEEVLSNIRLCFLFLSFCFILFLRQHDIEMLRSRVTHLLSDGEAGVHTADGLIIGQQDLTVLAADHILLTRQQTDTFPFRNRKKTWNALKNPNINR